MAKQAPFVDLCACVPKYWRGTRTLPACKSAFPHAELFQMKSIIVTPLAFTQVTSPARPLLSHKFRIRQLKANPFLPGAVLRAAQVLPWAGIFRAQGHCCAPSCCPQSCHPSIHPSLGSSRAVQAAPCIPSALWDLIGRQSIILALIRALFSLSSLLPLIPVSAHV